MKKFYTLFILAFVAIAVNAQVLKDAQAVDGRRPLVKHEMPSVFTPAPSLGINKLTPSKRAARRISSRDDILGTYLQIYYSYFDQSYTAVPLTIMRNTLDKKGVLIKGWWGDFTKTLKATVDVENGTISIAANQKLYEYTGNEDCRVMKFVPAGGPKSCEYGCLGYGNCVNACAFDAIHVVDGVAVVDKEKCKACGACVSACPNNLIELIPYDSHVCVACSSKNKGPEVMKACSVGCIGCSICAKNCPSEAIEVSDNLAKIDYEKCIECGTCLEKCPKKAIIGK